jgi:UDP-N-acetyl-D-glucosamine dehydrogenase
VDDTRETPAIDIINLLKQKGAQVDYNDPFVPTLQTQEGTEPLRSVELTPESLRSYDAVVIVTDHSSYDWDFVAAKAALLVDTRNATKNVKERGNIRKL